MFEAVAGAPIVPDPGRRVSVDRARMVLVYLAARANDDGVAWPSVRTIARYHAISTGSAREALHLLERQGLIEAIGNRRGGKSPTNYRVTTPGLRGGTTPGPRSGGDESNLSGAPEASPPGLGADLTGGPVPNVMNHPNVSEGGGGQLPAPDGAVAALLEFVTERIPDTVQATPAIQDEMARLFALDWGPLTLAAHVTADWPRKVKSSATGILTHRLRAITEPPSFDLAYDVATEFVSAPFAALEACPHGGLTKEGLDLDRRVHLDDFLGDLWDIDDDSDIDIDRETGRAIIAAGDMEILRRVVDLVDRYARLCQGAA